MRICSDAVSLDEIDIQTCKIIEAHKHVTNLCWLRNFSFVTTFTQKQDLSGNKFLFLIVVRELDILVAVYRDRERGKQLPVYKAGVVVSKENLFLSLGHAHNFAWYFPIMF